MKNFTNQTFDAIKWNAKQSCTEFKELVDDANNSLLSSFKTAIKEHSVGGKELQDEVCSLKQQVFTIQTSLDALMQKSPQFDRKIVERVDVAPTPSQVYLGSTISSNTGDLVSQVSVPSNVTCGRVLPIKMIFPSFGGVHDENDPLVYLERCKDFLALRPMSNREILATMRSVLHASARDWWETVRFKVDTWESFQQAF